MNSEEQSIGMMEGAFFVPKSDLLNWVNKLLSLEITKIQQLGTGAVYCQIIDVMYPGKVSMQKLNWLAKNQWQFLNNYKILQNSFAKCKIQKYIDIQKLCKCKYQDNLQFIQWLKRYFDIHNKTDSSAYDAKVMRKNAEIDFSFVQLRNPLKIKQRQAKDSAVVLKKSKSPYDKVRSKINNRSLTLDKNNIRESQFYKEKLSKIYQILKTSKKQNDKISKIKEIMEQFNEQELKQVTNDQVSDLNKMDKVSSKKIIENGKKEKKLPSKI